MNSLVFSPFLNPLYVELPLTTNVDPKEVFKLVQKAVTYRHVTVESGKLLLMCLERIDPNKVKEQIKNRELSIQQTRVQVEILNDLVTIIDGISEMNLQNALKNQFQNLYDLFEELKTYFNNESEKLQNEVIAISKHGKRVISNRDTLIRLVELRTDVKRLRFDDDGSKQVYYSRDNLFCSRNQEPLPSELHVSLHQVIEQGHDEIGLTLVLASIRNGRWFSPHITVDCAKIDRGLLKKFVAEISTDQSLCNSTKSLHVHFTNVDDDESWSQLEFCVKVDKGLYWTVSGAKANDRIEVYNFTHQYIDKIPLNNFLTKINISHLTCACIAFSPLLYNPFPKDIIGLIFKKVFEDLTLPEERMQRSLKNIFRIHDLYVNRNNPGYWPKIEAKFSKSASNLYAILEIRRRLSFDSQQFVSLLEKSSSFYLRTGKISKKVEIGNFFCISQKVFVEIAQKFMPTAVPMGASRFREFEITPPLEHVFEVALKELNEPDELISSLSNC